MSGDKDNDAQLEAQDDPAVAWAHVLIAALRLAAADYPNDGAAASRLFDALVAAMRAGSTQRDIHAGWREFRSRIDPAFPPAPGRRDHLLSIADDGARLMAERAARDPAARGRASQREERMMASVRTLVDWMNGGRRG